MQAEYFVEKQKRPQLCKAAVDRAPEPAFQLRIDRARKTGPLEQGSEFIIQSCVARLGTYGAGQAKHQHDRFHIPLRSLLVTGQIGSQKAFGLNRVP